MSLIAFASPNTRFNATDMRSANSIFSSQVAIRTRGALNSAYLTIGQFCIPMSPPKRKAILGCCVLKIVLVSALKKVFWVKALRVIAAVADKDALGWHPTMRQLKHESMGTPRYPIYVHKAVTVLPVGSRPFPAAVFGNLPPFHEPLHGRKNAGLMAVFNALTPILMIVIPAISTAHQGLSTFLATAYKCLPDMGKHYTGCCLSQGR